MPGVPLCSESVAGCDSSVELYFESPLGCPMFDNVAFLTKKLFDTTNATATALEVANTSCTSDTEPDVHRRLAPAAASVAFLFHTHGLEEAEKIVALLPADESALASTLNVPVTPGSVKISIRAPSESSDLHRKPVELLAGFGVPVLIACCLGGIFAGHRRRRASIHPAPPAPAKAPAALAGGEGEPPNPPWRRPCGYQAARAKIAEQTPQQIQRV